MNADPLAPIPTGDRLTWWVPSETDPRVRYRVDASANNGAGWCSCVDHGTRRQPALDRGEAPHTKATFCKHQERVRMYEWRRYCQDVARSECEPRRKSA